MNPIYSLPSGQRRVQQLVVQFNADEELWLSLESKRRRRRKCYPNLAAELHGQLDLLEFAQARPPEDCIGFFPET